MFCWALVGLDAFLRNFSKTVQGPPGRKRYFWNVIFRPFNVSDVYIRGISFELPSYLYCAFNRFIKAIIGSVNRRAADRRNSVS